MPLTPVAATDATVQTVVTAAATKKNLLLGFLITAYGSAAGAVTIKSGSTTLASISVPGSSTPIVVHVAPSDEERWDNLIAANEALTVTGAANVTFSGYVIHQAGVTL